MYFLKHLKGSFSQLVYNLDQAVMIYLEEFTISVEICMLHFKLNSKHCHKFQISVYCIRIGNMVEFKKPHELFFNYIINKALLKRIFSFVLSLKIQKLLCSIYYLKLPFSTRKVSFISFMLIVVFLTFIMMFKER